MPTRTRPFDLLARSGQDVPSVAAGPGQPPGPAGAVGSLGTAEEPPGAGLRLVAVPDGWPPYDCETHGAVCPAAAPVPAAALVPPAIGQDVIDQGGGGQDNDVAAAAIAPERVTAPSAGRTATPRGEGSPRGEALPRGDATSHVSAPPSLAAAWPGQFGQVLVEILAGFRPVKQLAPWTTERVRAQIDLLSCAVAAERRPRIRRVLTSRPTADVVEMTMVVSLGPRSRALAIRFERIPARPPVPGRPARPARWLCTEIETS